MKMPGNLNNKDIQRLGTVVEHIVAGRLLPRMALCGVLAVSGLLGYMAYIGIRWGHPLAFATAHDAWQGGTFLGRLVSAATLVPFRDFHVSAGGWFVGCLGLTIWSFWRLRLSLALYALGSLALPYFSLGITDFDEPLCADVLSRVHVHGHPVQGQALARQCPDRDFRGGAFS